jgi:hypothetical protein
MRRVLPGGAHPYFSHDNFDVGSANPNRDGLYEYRAFANIWLLNLFPLGAVRAFSVRP